MRIFRLSESCWLIRGLPYGEAAEVSRRLGALNWPGVDEIVPGLDSLAVYGQPQPGWEAAFREEMASPATHSHQPRVHVVPVCYSRGLDVDAAARELGIEREDLIQLHSSAVYRVGTIGFQPGFPYLIGLPPQLCGLPRLASPRPRVPTGSVAIAHDQAGIYPSASPGGWWLIGQTPLTICAPQEPYFPIEPGDHVRFVPIGEQEFGEREGERL